LVDAETKALFNTLAVTLTEKEATTLGHPLTDM